MKWWELLWLLNDNIDFLRRILDNSKWADYRTWFDNRDDIRIGRDVSVLDALVPDELCIAALEGCKFRFDFEKGVLYGGFRKDDESKLTAVQAFEISGGEGMIASIDRGEFAISDKKARERLG